MFGRVAFAHARRGCGQLVLTRSVCRNIYQSAPPMRHLTVWHKFGLFFFVAASMLAYPTYMLMNLDNIRPFTRTEFNDELKEILEERRRLRAEGKLYVLQKKL
ncbi:hypothetical protein GPALN_011599 [Globodera pallida]|nr:hypothetical protein GPALN_011599 [Globodera pallida]